MKKILSITLLLIGASTFAQEKASVEKSIFNIQTGFVGLWVNNELKLSDQIALHSEIGMEPSWFVGNGTQWHPNFRLEPRFYYNLNKRSEKGLNISKNTGNFFAIAFNYRPETVLFPNNKNLGAIESFSIVPKWGIRRNLGKSFNYEAGAGLGFRHETNYGNYGEIDLHFRIGYSF
ncbi:hypothetical protein [Kaistella sp.]|uniref:hypothetical protein n=1 Tax=Kaistella sp. TaxID=2782235 RepID=UPI00359FDEC1